MTSNKFGNFLIGSLVGVGIAAVATLILTPFSGAAFRRKVKNKLSFLEEEVKPAARMIKKTIAKKSKSIARAGRKVAKKVKAVTSTGQQSNHSTVRHNGEPVAKHAKRAH